PAPAPRPPPDPDAIAAARLGKALQENMETELAAWTQLLARWQVSSTEVSVRDATHCQTIVFPGFNCLRGHAALDQLVRFDRPLILPLQHDNAHGYALLLGSGKRVLLSFGGEPLRLGADQLRDYWNGDFIAVWRLPDHVPAKLRVGDAGPGVAWVQAQVSRMDSAKPADAGPAYFDATLEERIRKLQVAYGIRPDGIVGQETLFALSALDQNGPHLARDVD
ncbi:MAG TPA: peptidoglycan-binding protein, partial [Rudaea sp.]|nr:peptidoglycan-binding protein [Rudaea sp.]